MKKLLLSLGALSMATLPIATVVSCQTTKDIIYGDNTQVNGIKLTNKSTNQVIYFFKENISRIYTNQKDSDSGKLGITIYLTYSSTSWYWYAYDSYRMESF